MPLSYGWSLVRDAATGDAFFERKGYALNPGEFAAMSQARTIYREMKRKLDEMDWTGFKSDDFDWQGLDRACFALELSLRERERWSPELKQTGVGVTA